MWRSGSRACRTRWAWSAIDSAWEEHGRCTAGVDQVLGLRPGAHDSAGPELLLPVLAEPATQALAEGPDSVAVRAVSSARSQGEVGGDVDLAASLGLPCDSGLVSAAGSSARQRCRSPPLGEAGKGGRPQAPT